MPQRVVVIWSCSLCGTETDSQDKVTQYQLSGGGRVLGYDICATCAAAHPFADFLAAGLSENATGRTAPAGADGKVACPHCAKAVLPNGLGYHMSRVHGVQSAHAAELEARGKSGKFKCDQCDFRSPRPQGIGAHKRSKHGAVGTSHTAVTERAKKKAT